MLESWIFSLLLQDWGHPPCTKLQRFVHGNNCQRCNTEYRDESQENDLTGGSTMDEWDGVFKIFYETKKNKKKLIYITIIAKPVF